MFTLPGFALSSDHPLISRFIKGVYNIWPSVPRYAFTWDTDKPLSYIKTKLSPNSDLSLKEISHKVACLLVILVGQRVDNVFKILVPHINLTDDLMVCHILSLCKTTKASNPNKPLKYRANSHDPDLCPVQGTNHYLSLRKELVDPNTDQLFITYGKAHHPAAKGTVANWIKASMKAAGITILIFTPGS